jgi:GNAT superfamily N-acetyltransferase
MIDISKVDTSSKSQVTQFVQFPFTLYANCKQWVPPFWVDVRTMMDKNKHPFYEHSDAEFFLAKRDGEIVGRIAGLENRSYNRYHESKQASIYFYESIDDQKVANALFERIFDWSHQRGLNYIVAQKGFSLFDGYGIQVEGFEHRQMMTMMNYNFAYMPGQFEAAGFNKENEFVSCYMHKSKFDLPEKVRLIAQKVQDRGVFKVLRFDTKAQLKQWAFRIGEAYNKTFINNWEYYPLTKREIQYIADTILQIADPKLITLLLHEEQVIGFIFAFADISAALQRQKGHLTPWALVDFLLEMKRTKWVSLNGVGMLPEYQGRGGNALMYAVMERVVKDYGFEHAEQTQMADSAVQVRQDMVTIGAEIYKRHRIYGKEL